MVKLNPTMQVVINRTINVEQIEVNACGQTITLDAELRVLSLDESWYVDWHFEMSFLIDTDWHSIEWEPAPEWLTELIKSKPAVGELLDAKYHGLFADFINQYINI